MSRRTPSSTDLNIGTQKDTQQFSAKIQNYYQKIAARKKPTFSTAALGGNLYGNTLRGYLNNIISLDQAHATHNVMELLGGGLLLCMEYNAAPPGGDMRRYEEVHFMPIYPWASPNPFAPSPPNRE